MSCFHRSFSRSSPPLSAAAARSRISLGMPPVKIPLGVTSADIDAALHDPAMT